MKEQITDIIRFSADGLLVLVTENNRYALEIEDGQLVLTKVAENNSA